MFEKDHSLQELQVSELKDHRSPGVLPYSTRTVTVASETEPSVHVLWGRGSVPGTARTSRQAQDTGLLVGDQTDLA
jgi:hypothetical protein